MLYEKCKQSGKLTKFTVNIVTAISPTFFLGQWRHFQKNFFFLFDKISNSTFFEKIFFWEKKFT